MLLRAQVRNGRLELSEPTDLPEGEIVELELVDERYATDREWLTEEQIEAKVVAAYEESLRDPVRIPAADVIAKLRARHQQG